MSSIILLTFLTIFLSVGVSAQTDEERKLVIDEFVSRAEKTFESSKKVFTVTETRKSTKFSIEESNFKIQKGASLTRKFSYTKNGNDIEVLAVYYTVGTVSAEEIYFFKDKELIYATERHFLRSGEETNSIWSAFFYFAGGKLIGEGSNGHGKSEDDEWDSEKEVLMMSRKRIEQLNKYLAR